MRDLIHPIISIVHDHAMGQPPATRANLLEGLSIMIAPHLPREAGVAQRAAEAIREAETAQLLLGAILQNAQEQDGMRETLHSDESGTNARDRLKEIRALMELTQAQFAQLVGYTRSYISQIEAGVKEPGSRFLAAIDRIATPSSK